MTCPQDLLPRSEKCAPPQALKTFHTVAPGVVRYGTRFLRTSSYKYEAIEALNKFLEEVQRRSKRDQGGSLLRA
jgi:hypothetical protein